MSAKLTFTTGIRERIKTAKLMKPPSLGANASPTKKRAATSELSSVEQPSYTRNSKRRREFIFLQLP